METMLLFFFIVLSISSLILYGITLMKLKKSTISTVGMFLENVKLNETLKTINLKSNLSESEIHRENFIKFLSDSRDWAFQYIEDVQNSIKKFIVEVEPQIKYSNKEDLSLNDFAAKKISKELEELKKFLPTDQENKR